MAGRRDDPGVVPAAGQQEGDRRVGQQPDLVDRAPGRDVVLRRADGEDRNVDVGQGDRAALDLVLAARQAVLQEQGVEILRVHVIGHARRVRVPRHEVALVAPLAQEVVVDHARPEEIVRAQQREGAGHLAAVEEALAPHQVVQVADLVVVDEEAELAGFGEVDLGGQQGHARQAPVAVARHGGGGRREQGAAEAVADRVNAPVRNDRRDRVESGHHAEAPVALHVEVPVLGRRVAPREAEHRVAPLDQVADEGILRREVQDVVLHDPGGHDQHRFRVHAPGLRAVLDQLNQPVPVDHPARRDGDLAARSEPRRRRRLAVQDPVLPVGQEVLEPAPEVLAAALGGRPLQHGVGRQEVARRPDVEQLAHDEGRLGLVVLGDSRDLGHQVVPPLLRQEEALHRDAVGRLPPEGVLEALVVGQRFDQRLRRAAAERRAGVLGEPRGHDPGVAQHVALLARREQEIGAEIGEGEGQGDRRRRLRLRQGGADHAVELARAQVRRVVLHAAVRAELGRLRGARPCGALGLPGFRLGRRSSPGAG